MSRIIGFFKGVKNELFKVVWPTRAQTITYTATVIIFSIAVALILGAADYGLLKGFEQIIK